MSDSSNEKFDTPLRESDDKPITEVAAEKLRGAIDYVAGALSLSTSNGGRSYDSDDDSDEEESSYDPPDGWTRPRRGSDLTLSEEFMLSL